MSTSASRKVWGIRAGVILLVLVGALLGGLALSGLAAAATPLLVKKFSVSPKAFSPNGDGIADKVTVKYRLSANAKVWVTVTKGKKLIASIQKSKAIKKGMRPVVWNGKNKAGKFVAAGVYSVNIYAQAGSSKGKPFPLKVPVTVRFKVATQATTLLAGSDGRVLARFPAGDALLAGVSGLAGNSHYRMMVRSPSGAMVSQARFLTDASGVIPQSVLAYDIGLSGSVSGASRSAASRTARVDAGTYVVTLFDDNGAIAGTSTITVDPTARAFYASDVNGLVTNSFLKGSQTVYAHGANFTPNSSLRVYAIEDTASPASGAPLVDVTGQFKMVTVAANGTFNTAVWPNAGAVGAYDLVADLNGNGKYDAGEPIDDAITTGFMVQVPRSTAPIIAQIACDANRVYRDIFTTGQDVYVYISPLTQQFGHAFVNKYVVKHKSAWTAGMALVDVTAGGTEMDQVEHGCTNEGRVLVWTHNLTPGIYDVVIDVNKNGKYDPGVDFLDNINSNGEPIGGFIVPNPNVAAPVVTLSSPAQNASFTTRHCTVEGTVNNAAITAASLYVDGVFQSSLNVSAGHFTGDALLHANSNNISVVVVGPGGSSSAGATVNGNFSKSKIWVTLTWTDPLAHTSTSDVDMHVWQPDGGHVYYSSKGSANTTVAGQGWLDVDDTNGFGPENYVVNVGPTVAGTYQVKVDYYTPHGNVNAANKAQPVSCNVQVVLNEGTSGQVIRHFGPQQIAVNDSNGSNPAAWWYVCNVAWNPGTGTGTITSP